MMQYHWSSAIEIERRVTRLHEQPMLAAPALWAGCGLRSITIWRFLHEQKINETNDTRENKTYTLCEGAGI
jgi:hypothetical protein